MKNWLPILLLLANTTSNGQINLDSLAGVRGSLINGLQPEWFGAKGDGTTDDSKAIQRTIDAVISHSTRVNIVLLSEKDYLINNPLILYNWSGSMYEGFTVKLKGQSSFWQARGGTRIICNFKDRFGIGIQCGKNAIVEGLIVRGKFTPPNLTTAEFYKASYASWNDPTCRDATYSPYSGIVIDPFTNGQLPDDGGYPGTDAYGNKLSTFYRGGGGNGGSTATLIENCFLQNFTVGICSSPNSYTRNAELTKINRCQFAEVRLCLSSSHDQEKSCEMTFCGCWANTHTVFASHIYGAALPGEWRIDNFNIAGKVNRFISHDCAGYFPFHVSYIFSESLGTFGTLNSQVGGSVSNSEIGFAYPRESMYMPAYIESSGIIFSNDNIRLYGSFLPVSIRGSSMYDHCNFEVCPYFTGNSTFNDCTAYGVPFGPSKDVTSNKDSRDILNYGNFKLFNQAYFTTGVQSSHHIDDHTPFSAFYMGQQKVAMTNNSFVLPYSELVDLNQLVLYVDAKGNLQPAGIVTSIKSAGITISYSGIANGTYDLYGMFQITFAVPFLGDVVQGSNLITNVKSDDTYPLSSNVGKWIKSECHTTDNYSPYVKILSFDGNAYRVGSKSFYSIVGQYFSIATRNIYLQGANSTLYDNMILPKGSKISMLVNGVRVERTVTKSGFVNNKNDTRQFQSN